MRLSQAFRQLEAPAMLGKVIDGSSPEVQIITRSSSAISESPPVSKYDERTLMGKTPSPGMARIPKRIGERINAMTRNSQPQLIRQRVAQIYQQLSKGAAYAPALDKETVDAQIQGLFLQDYVSIAYALREVQKRCAEFKPQSVLSVGFGPGTGVLAAREIFDAPEETAVIIGHPRMMARAKELLKDEESDERQLKLRYDIPSGSSPKRFDLIIASHQLHQTGKFNTELADSHAQQLTRLLSGQGILVFVERGDPLGFEAVAIARDQLLRPKHGLKVVAPCAHSGKCPLQIGLTNREYATNPGKQNWCRFAQNVERPRFTTELKKGRYLAQKWVPGWAGGPGGEALKGSGRAGMTNSETAHFSWVAMTREKEGIEDSLPRILKTPYKRQRHVLMEVCAPEGEIQQWTVPKSQGQQAYHDARKAEAGDLWALDAKVKQKRGGLRNLDRFVAQSEASQRASSVKEVSTDWWLPKSNPFYRYSSHQARKRAEMMMEPESDSFLAAVDSLERDAKVDNREVHSRYQRTQRRD